MFSGAPGGRGTDTPGTEKMVVEKWCYFSDLYKLTKVLEDRRINWIKINFPFLYVNSKIFSNFLILIGFCQNGRKFESRQLNFF